MKREEQYKIIETTIRRWMLDNFSYSFTGNLVINYEVTFLDIYIYTNYPGTLIGKAGETVAKLEAMLKAGGIKKDIEFIDLGFSKGIPHRIRVVRNIFCCLKYKIMRMIWRRNKSK